VSIRRFFEVFAVILQILGPSHLHNVNGHLKIPTFGHEKPAHLAI
jgi:hypothetical protein